MGEFLNKKSTVYDNFQSESSNDEEEKKTSKFELRLEKVQKHAIEKSYEANKDFLKTFESFEKGDKISSNKENKNLSLSLIRLLLQHFIQRKLSKKNSKKKRNERMKEKEMKMTRGKHQVKRRV